VSGKTTAAILPGDTTTPLDQATATYAALAHDPVDSPALPRLPPRRWLCSPLTGMVEPATIQQAAQRTVTPSWHNLLHDFARAFYSPKSLYTDMRDGRPTPSWLCVLVYCAVYVVACLWLYFSGYEPFATPWIALRSDIYYLVEAFYLTPLILLLWIQGAATIHVLARLFKGKGRFDATLRMTGYSLWAPWYPLIIVDSIHATPEWLYYGVLTLCVVLLLVGTTISTRIEQSIGWVGAVTSSLLAILGVGVMLLVFIR